MELRDHPQMRFHGLRTWPPIWSNTTALNQRKLLYGEHGVLKQCCTNKAVTNICFLFIEADGEFYCGALVVDDVTFCNQLLTIFNQHIGRTIAEIGRLDLSHTL